MDNLWINLEYVIKIVNHSFYGNLDELEGFCDPVFYMLWMLMAVLLVLKNIMGFLSFLSCVHLIVAIVCFVCRF